MGRSLAYPMVSGQYKVPDDRKSITLATTGLGVIRLNSSSDSHTNTHEIFHSIVHFSRHPKFILGWILSE